MIKIKVKNSGIIKLQSFNDFPDGRLVIAEVKKHIPFEIKRIYFITTVFRNRSSRGRHAHRKLEQYIFCLNGNCVLELDDGKKKQKMTLHDPNYGVKLGPMLWHTMKNFSKDCVLLVVANDHYDESDYIRDYAEFLRLARKKK
jgi:uncharacterized cupin superfamily protein